MIQMVIRWITTINKEQHQNIYISKYMKSSYYIKLQSTHYCKLSNEYLSEFLKV